LVLRVKLYLLKKTSLVYVNPERFCRQSEHPRKGVLYV
jgi:hypothetical protein